MIYFGEELDDFTVEVLNDTILIDGRPLIPPYTTLDIEEESEFHLDDATQKAVEESLELLDPSLPFEDNAKRVASYLKEKGVTVRKGEYYGDIYVETDEGWGITVLFNEQARIKMSTPSGEPGSRVPVSDLKALLSEGLVIVDKGFLSLVPAQEAEEILQKLKKIYTSGESISQKVKQIQELLGIPEESAKKLLMQHT